MLEYPEPITNYKWINNKSHQDCRFSLGHYRFWLSYAPKKHFVWHYTKYNHYNKLICKGRYAKDKLKSSAELAAALGLSTISLSLIMKDFDEYQILRSLADLQGNE